MQPTATPTKIKDQVTLTFGPIEITGDLYLASSLDGGTAAYLATEVGLEHISINLAAYRIFPRPGAIFVKNYSDHEGLAQSIVNAGLGTITDTVTFGPFHTTASEITLEA